MGIAPESAAVTWLVPLRAAWLGLARAGDTLWASGGVTSRVYRFVPNGSAWTADSIVLADSMTRLFVGGLAVVPGRGLIAAVGNLNDSVYLIDAATLRRRGAFAIGHRPYTVVADSSHLYVSNWGDSTVSIINLSDSPAVRPSDHFVGPHPSALALHGRELFVALAGANGVARVDLATGRVLEQLTVALAPRAPVGSDPNALALAPDGRTLYVAMAGNNAVAVVRLSARAMRVVGLIPAGWYPTAVAVAADGRTLYAHALARRWVLCDNFYVDGEVSADGHQWSTRAFAGDYNEKTWPAIYGGRRNDNLEDGEDVKNPRDAYLWDAARRKGLWVVNFGE